MADIELTFKDSQSICCNRNQNQQIREMQLQTKPNHPSYWSDKMLEGLKISPESIGKCVDVFQSMNQFCHWLWNMQIRFIDCPGPCNSIASFCINRSPNWISDTEFWPGLGERNISEDRVGFTRTNLSTRRSLLWTYCIANWEKYSLLIKFNCKSCPFQGS